MLHDTRKGFSLVELLVVVGMMTVLLSIGGLSLASFRSGSQLDLIAAEVRAEIMRAQAETSNGYPSGVYFENDRYVYFAGTSFVEGAATNEESTLPDIITFTDISLPSAIISFDNVTGNPLNFVSPYHITIADSVEARTISVNAWGVVEVN